MNRPTKGSIEAEIASAVTRFQREQQGRGATDIKVHLLGEMVIVRSGGIFTPTEARLAVSEEGRRLIKSARVELRSINREEIERIVAEIVGCEIIRSYYDVAVEAAEQMEVYVLSTDIEHLLLRQDLDRLGDLSQKSGHTRERGAR